MRSLLLLPALFLAGCETFVETHYVPVTRFQHIETPPPPVQAPAPKDGVPRIIGPIRVSTPDGQPVPVGPALAPERQS